VPSWVNIPNLLTLLRLFMVPVVVYYIRDGRYFLAGWLFGGAAFTDILDGAAARLMGVSTKVGAYLDPVADKCLLCGVFLALAWVHIVPWWLVGLVFGRDLYILAAVGLFMLFTPLRGFPPSVWGKVSTFVQIATVIIWIAHRIFRSPLRAVLAPAMLWPCVGFTVWSGLDYTWRGIRLLRKY
jgi:cardiolipin synthase